MIRYRLTSWFWPLAILGIGYALYTTYKHLLANDSLVETFYKIAGGEESYNNLPEFNPDQENADNSVIGKAQKPSVKPEEIKNNTSMTAYRFYDISWKALEHPVYRFTTQDGRKGMLVKGLNNFTETHTEAIMVFVEKLSPYDLPPILPEWLMSTLIAICLYWANPLSKKLESASLTRGRISQESNTTIYASITTNMANEFIAQRGVINQLNPQIVEVVDDNKSTTNQTLPQVRDADSDDE